VLGEGSDHLARLEKIFEKLFKNLLTNATKYGIIYVSVRESIPLKIKFYG
jgi:hypothetical protein